MIFLTRRWHIIKSVVLNICTEPYFLVTQTLSSKPRKSLLHFGLGEGVYRRQTGNSPLPFLPQQEKGTTQLPKQQVPQDTRCYEFRVCVLPKLTE